MDFSYGMPLKTPYGKDKYKDVEAEVLKAIETNFEASKKKKPQAFDSEGQLKKVKGITPMTLKTLKLPPCDRNSNKINGLCWAPPGPNETRLAYCRQDHMFGIFDITKNAGVYGGKASWAQCIALHPSKDIVLTGGMDNATTIWKNGDNPGKLVEVTKLILHDGYISSLDFINGGDQFISAGGDADIHVVDVEKKASVVKMCGHDKDAQSVSWAANDVCGPQKRFATCSSDQTVKMWDVTSGKCTMTFGASSDPMGELNACAMFPNGNAIACGGEKDKTYLLDVRTGKMVSKYARNNQKTSSCVFSNSGRHLYIGHDDGALITWDIFDSGENKAYASKADAHTTFYGGTKNIDITHSRVQQMKVNSDGMLATCGFDGKIKIWTAGNEA